MTKKSNKSNEFNAEKLKQERLRTQQLEAETEAKKADAEAKKKVIDVETEAKVKEIKEQSAERIKQFALETTKKGAEVTEKVSNAEKVGAEARLVAQKVWRRRLPFLAGLVLAADYIYHDFEPFVRWRMKYKIRDTHRHQKSQSLENFPSLIPLHPEQQILPPDFIPVLLLGPTGCGKSTYLARYVKQYMETPPPLNPAPVVLISVRDASTEKQRPLSPTTEETGIVTDKTTNTQRGTDEAVEDKTKSTTVETKETVERAAVSRMKKIAGQVFEAIGFPSRPSWISYVKRIQFHIPLFANAEAEIKFEEMETKNRFIFALHCLFGACTDIRNNRHGKQHCSELDSAPVLLFDEVHDLVKDPQLANIGGKEIFATLAQLIVTNGVNSPIVRSIIAGSSGRLTEDIKRTILKGGTRYTPMYLLDPEITEVKKSLAAKGYSDDECAKIINFCGTRLRLLHPLFRSKLNVNLYLQELRETMEDEYKTIFDSLSIDDKKRMVKILDTMYKISSSNLNELPPKWKELPIDVQTANYSTLLYVRRNDNLEFQSQAVRTVWPTVRKEYKNETIYDKLLSIIQLK